MYVKNACQIDTHSSLFARPRSNYKTSVLLHLANSVKFVLSVQPHGKEELGIQPAKASVPRRTREYHTMVLGLGGMAFATGELPQRISAHHFQ